MYVSYEYQDFFSMVLETGIKVVILIFKIWSSSLNATAVFRNLCSYNLQARPTCDPACITDLHLALTLAPSIGGGRGLPAWKSRNNCQGLESTNHTKLCCFYWHKDHSLAMLQSFKPWWTPQRQFSMLNMWLIKCRCDDAVVQTDKKALNLQSGERCKSLRV